VVTGSGRSLLSSSSPKGGGSLKWISEEERHLIEDLALRASQGNVLSQYQLLVLEILRSLPTKVSQSVSQWLVHRVRSSSSSSSSSSSNSNSSSGGGGGGDSSSCSGSSSRSSFGDGGWSMWRTGMHRV